MRPLPTLFALLLLPCAHAAAQDLHWQQTGYDWVRCDLSADVDLIEIARRHAFEMIKSDPTLANPQHERIRQRIERRYERGMELFRVG